MNDNNDIVNDETTKVVMTEMFDTISDYQFNNLDRMYDEWLCSK